MTAPTPEMGISAKFYSEDHDQRSEANCVLETANAFCPDRLTALASISKALGTGADMLLGVGNGVFDDMLDAGVICNSTSRLRAPAASHAGDYVGDDWLGAQSLGKSQAETRFLGQSLRRKSTGRITVSQRGVRLWKRVFRILRSSRRSSRSAHDQEKTTASAPACLLEGTTNGPLNASRGWKRFSRILANATVSSRHRSAGDELAGFVDPLEGGCSGVPHASCTIRRRGLDIRFDNTRYDGEPRYGSSSPDMVTPVYINEKHAATHVDNFSTDITTFRELVRTLPSIMSQEA